MIKEFAFVGIPVTDMKRARAFYEDILGLKPATTDVNAAMFEYEVGNATLSIAAYGERWKPVSGGGTMAAFETDDLDGLMERVKASGAVVEMDLTESPVCRFGIVLDPDGTAIMLHKRKSA
ncbi:MAG: VOC family protein [Chthoniobacterales bacterium]